MLDLVWPFRKPEAAHKEVRFIVGSKAEQRLAHRRYLDRQLELAVAVCNLTDDEKSLARKRAERRSAA